jgi:hypothetical protein
MVMGGDRVSVGLQDAQSRLNFSCWQRCPFVSLIGLVRNHHPKISIGLSTQAGQCHCQSRRTTVGRDQNIYRCSHGEDPISAKDITSDRPDASHSGKKRSQEETALNGI